jgi:hypothetical protein
LDDRTYKIWGPGRGPRDGREDQRHIGHWRRDDDTADELDDETTDKLDDETKDGLDETTDEPARQRQQHRLAYNTINTDSA